MPHGHVLVTRNRDEPGGIGFIGSVLGDHGADIAGTFDARETDGGEALTVSSLDDPLTDDVRGELLADDRLTEATATELGEV